MTEENQQGHHHQQQQENILFDEQPLKVLGLFQKRTLQSALSINDAKYIKLYDTLRCAICHQLFNNPVYLRCSHRFCKQCIEKYIRANNQCKKACPNCRGQLTTKRDVRGDSQTSSIISSAFGDRKIFQQNMNQIQMAQLQRTDSRSSGVFVRSKSHASHPDQQTKQIKKRLNRGQQAQQLPSPSQQQRPKKRRGRIPNSQKLQIMNAKLQQYNKLNKQSDNLLNTTQDASNINLDIFKSIPQLSQPPDQPATQFNQTEVQEPRQKIRRKRGRKKQTPIVEVLSNSDSSVAQIHVNSYILKSQKQIIGVEELREKQIRQKEEPSSIQRKRPGRKPGRRPNVVQVPSLLSFVEQQSQKYQPPETKLQKFEQNKQLIKKQFGQNYLFTIMKLNIFDFIIPIRLQRHPDAFFTPKIQCKSIQLSLKSKFSSIMSLFSKFLNVPSHHINLYINTSTTPKLLDYSTYSQKTFLQLNQQQWKSAIGIELFDIHDLIKISEETKQLLSFRQKSYIYNKQGQIKFKKSKLFENMQIQKYTRSNIPKKRGRKSKKIFEYENTSVKQYNRVIYYSLCCI